MEVDVPMVIVETQGARRPDGEVDRQGAKRVKLEANGVVWGEELSEPQLQIAKFMVSGPEESNSQMARQSVLPVMTGNTWMAYTIAKEMAWQAVDRAWSLAGVDEWEDWGPDEIAGATVKGGMLPVTGGDEHGCGTTQAALKQERGSQGGGTSKNKGGKRKTKLPGVSASQQSVRDFFEVKTNKSVSVENNKTGDECVVGVECELVPGGEAQKYQKGGEGTGVNSTTMLINKQPGSVAELRTLVLAENGGEGVQKNENILQKLFIKDKDHSEYWRQKLSRFRAVPSEHSQEKPCCDNLKQK